MFESAHVFSTIPNVPSCHSSNLIALPDNTIRVAFFAGQFEKSPDVAIWGATLQRDDTTLQWSQPEILVDVPNCSMGSPVWYLTPQNKLFLFYLVMHHGRILPPGWSVCTIQYKTSSDLGKTWSDCNYLRKFWFWVTRALPELNALGEVFLPMHRELGKEQSFFYVNSKADLSGKWRRIGRLTTPKGCDEPCVALLKSKDMLCALRTMDKRIYFSRSKDNGYTWSKPQPSEFYNPNSQVFMRSLQSGRLLLAFNNTENGRSPLCLASSLDEGYTWSRPVILEDEPNKEFSYPSMIQTDDGKIHLSYTHHRTTIKYCVFDETWISEACDS